MRSKPVAMITGAAQGLGRACAERLADAGFDLALSDLHEPGSGTVIELARDLTSHGAAVHYARLDIADLASHADVVSGVIKRFGHIDALVDNAGIAARPLVDVLDLQPEAFDRSVDVNLRGTFFLTQLVARTMIDAGPCEHPRSVSVITSIAAELISVDRPQYCITKSALAMVAKLFASRLAEYDIAVFDVRPGLIRTAMTASAPTDALDAWVAEGRVPQRRWGSPDEIGHTIASLASGALPYATGQVVWPSGGIQLPHAP